MSGKEPKEEEERREGGVNNEGRGEEYRYKEIRVVGTGTKQGEEKKQGEEGRREESR